MEKIKSFKSSLVSLENNNFLLFFLFAILACLNVIFFKHSPLKVKSEVIHFSKKQAKASSIRVKLSVASEKQVAKKIEKKIFRKKAKLLRPQKKKVAKKIIKKSKVTQVKKVDKNFGQSSELAKYLTYIRGLVDKHKVYPRIAKRLKHSGVVKVELLIDSSGKLLSKKLIKKTSSLFLNSAAKKIFNEINSFAALPKEIKERPLTVIVPIVFELI